MKCVVVDNEKNMLNAMGTFLRNSFKVDVEEFNYTQEKEAEIVEYIRNNLTEDLYLLSDVYFNDQIEMNLPYIDFASIKLIQRICSGDKGLPKRVMFYSVNNPRGVEPIFDLVEGCSFMNLDKNAILEKNFRYSRYDKTRKDYMKKLEDFFGKSEEGHE